MLPEIRSRHIMLLSCVKKAGEELTEFYHLFYVRREPG